MSARATRGARCGRSRSPTRRARRSHERPALLVAANFEGDQLIGSELALYLAERLLTGYASDATIKKRLDAHAVYILPRVNPDGAERCSAR